MLIKKIILTIKFSVMRKNYQSDNYQKPFTIIKKIKLSSHSFPEKILLHNSFKTFGLKERATYWYSGNKIKNVFHINEILIKIIRFHPMEHSQKKK